MRAAYDAPRRLPRKATSCWDEGDVIYDPFGGSMTTGYVAEALGRRWIGSETVEEYVEGARFRFAESAIR